MIDEGLDEHSKDVYWFMVFVLEITLLPLIIGIILSGV